MSDLADLNKKLCDKRANAVELVKKMLAGPFGHVLLDELKAAHKKKEKR